MGATHTCPHTRARETSPGDRAFRRLTAALTTNSTLKEGDERAFRQPRRSSPGWGNQPRRVSDEAEGTVTHERHRRNRYNDEREASTQLRSQPSRLSHDGASTINPVPFHEGGGHAGACRGSDTRLDRGQGTRHAVTILKTQSVELFESQKHPVESLKRGGPSRDGTRLASSGRSGRDRLVGTTVTGPL